MTATLIDGKKVASEIEAEVEAAVKQKNLKLKLAIVLVGDDPASVTYTNNKAKACARAGIESVNVKLPAGVKQEDLVKKVRELDVDKSVNGILVQLPLPGHLDEQEVLLKISPVKDVDGYRFENMGKLMQNQDECLKACTPLGVMELLKRYEVGLAGKHAVVVGRSNTVGKPVALMLLRENATVTICHSKSNDLGLITRMADVLVVAVGKIKLITKDMVKPGAVVIDVGTNRSAEGKLVGDVDFENVKTVAGMISPVPGGVGPMTIACLLQNTVKAAEMQKKKLL